MGLKIHRYFFEHDLEDFNDYQDLIIRSPMPQPKPPEVKGDNKVI